MLEYIGYILIAFMGIVLCVFLFYTQKYLKTIDFFKDYTPLTLNEYSEDVIANTNNRMNDLISGIIKKHLLPNSAEPYDSNKVLKNYKKNINTSYMNKMVKKREETKYNG